MQKLLFLKPIFKERIWGGTKLSDAFHYNIPSDKVGECWAISAHPNGDCLIENGPLKGQTLSTVFKNNKEMFKNVECTKFPLLTKILDANNDLSIQVHPDDDYAFTHENESGKTECWYVIDAHEDAEIIYGHNAQTKEELRKLITNNRFDELLRRVKIKPGDFFYVPSGTIHALCKGTLVLETQQSSDTTYRVYDYNRKDDHGKSRELHVKQALDVIATPHKDTVINPNVKKLNDSTITTLIETSHFTVSKWEIKNTLTIPNDNFLLVSVLNGVGQFLDYEIKKGDHFIVSATNSSITCEGNLELIASHL